MNPTQATDGPVSTESSPDSGRLMVLVVEGNDAFPLGASTMPDKNSTRPGHASLTVMSI